MVYEGDSPVETWTEPTLLVKGGPRRLPGKTLGWGAPINDIVFVLANKPACGRTTNSIVLIFGFYGIRAPTFTFKRSVRLQQTRPCSIPAS